MDRMDDNEQERRLPLMGVLLVLLVPTLACCGGVAVVAWANAWAGVALALAGAVVVLALLRAAVDAHAGDEARTPAAGPSGDLRHGCETSAPNR